MVCPSRICSQLFILLIGLNTNCCNSAAVVKPVYFGEKWLKDIIFYPGRRTWLEARDVCWSLGGIAIAPSWKKLIWYIRTRAIRENWPPSENLWLGQYKVSNSSAWFMDKKNCEEKTNNFPGHLVSEEQCAVINMSMASHNDPFMMYASPCNLSYAFACSFYLDKNIPKGVGVYLNTEMVESGDFKVKYDSVFNETECAALSFNVSSTFQCYASTFDPENGSCQAECAEFTNIPDNVTLVQSSFNKTVLLRPSHRVFVNSTTPTGSGSFQFYPSCTTDTTTASDVTTTEDQSTALCSCFCATSVNMTEETLAVVVNDIKRKLAVNVTSLSASVRRKTSAADARTSSKAMGALGLGIITSVLLAMILSDLSHFIQFFNTVFSKLH
ncbi:uncharacterized protein LOC134247699 [Saccostrea cucullata]|uniref:uncharacterized protein LOC134247699 n=1 Tax=Saccostrea cuccullata TaxID=36930 RepID=UPI002ED58B7D